MYRNAPRAPQYSAPIGNPRVRERLKTLLIIILLIAVGFLSWRGIPAMRFQSEAQSLFIARIRTECSTAISLASSLSRTAGASTSASLAKIRSNIYGMKMLSDMSASTGSGVIIAEAWFTTLFDAIDSYYTMLNTGTATSDQQTSLYNNLNVLSDQLQDAR